MTFGKMTMKLAAADDLSEATRTAIREALGRTIEDIRHDLELAALALDGPDPEFALYEFTQVLKDVPASLLALESALAKRIPQKTRRAA